MQHMHTRDAKVAVFL